MSIKKADSAGFCFGVNRAINIVNELLEKGIKVATLGPIIHNMEMVHELEERGCTPVKAVDELTDDTTLVIRSHGVEKSVIDSLVKRGINFEDATCPFVKKIHKIVSNTNPENDVVLIAGNKNHPEVCGIIGHCASDCYTFNNEAELDDLLPNILKENNKQVQIVAQTTFDTQEWKKCVKKIKKLCTNAKIFDTICNATQVRQTEASQIAAESDFMVVIGDRHSSNTGKLFDICKRQCENTVLIETAAELDLNKVSVAESIGVTAGASTPARIIKEVLDTMSEVKSGETNLEPSFEEMLEESLKSLNTDEKVHGVVVGISPTEVYVDVGRKQAGFIPANELSNDPSVKPEDVVKIGDEMDLLIMKTNDQEGTIMLSKRRVDAMKGWDEIAEAQESGEVLEGKVIEVVKGGVIVLKGAMRVFVPASQATAARGEDLNELMGKEVRFRIIEVNRQRRRAVGSIRSVLREERKAAQEKFWEQIEEGQQYTGKVKSLTNFGAFVDLGGVDGMIHISELSWNRIKHPSEVLSVGDTVDVYVKGLDREHGKISLGYKRPEDNPWEKLKNEYPAGTVCDARVVGMTQFGAFANVIPGIDGLIHISQIADHRIEKPQDALKVGDIVKVKITDIDFDKHRVSLSIRALLEEQQEADDKAAAESTEDAVVYVSQESGVSEADEEAAAPSEE